MIVNPIPRMLPAIAVVISCYVLLGVPLEVAQGPNCDDKVGKIDHVDYPDTKDRLVVSLSKPINRQDLAAAPKESWVVLDIMEGSDRPVYLIREVIRGDDRNPQADEEFPTVLLFPLQPLKPGHHYRLFQSRLTFFGCAPDAPLEGAFEVKADVPAGTGPPAGGQTEEKKTSFFPRSASEGREDSNVYLSGQIEGSKGSKAQFSTDVKIDVPFATTSLFDSIGPYFNMKAGTVDEADANSLSFGAKLRHVRNISRPADPSTHQFVGNDRRILTGIVFDLTPGFESDRRFDNINTLFGTRLYFIPRVQGGFRRIYFQPFVGYEIGRNLKSPVEGADGRGLSRPLFGGSFYAYPFPKKMGMASIQVDYIRRFLLRREVSFTEDDDGKPVPLAVGKGPRDYIKASFGLDFSDFTSVTLSYEYGRLPPNFQLVNSEFGFGLVYKFRTTFPAEQ